MVVLDHASGLSITQTPIKEKVKPVVVLSTLVVGAVVSSFDGVLVGSGVVIGSVKEGDSEGISVSFGGVLGVEDGEDVGEVVSVVEGDTDGVPVGFKVVGKAVGSNDGVAVGRFVGDFVGAAVGDSVPTTGELCCYARRHIFVKNERNQLGTFLTKLNEMKARLQTSNAE